jgi:predicted RNA-binding Zn-ribbon protein involved in translation (DUF1610 family)
MELGFACPQCGAETRIDSAEESSVLSCAGCGYVGLLPLDWAAEGRVERCPICGSPEFYRQRDFHQRVALVVGITGVALSLLTRFLSIVAAGLAILLLYLSAPEVLVCYLCRAHIRGHRPGARHRRFDRRVEERVKRERSLEAGRRDREKGLR